MGRLITWCRDRPLPVLVTGVLLTAFFLFFALKVEVDSSTDGMMIEGDPERVFYADTLKIFGSDNITMVYIQDPDLFTPEKLRLAENVFYELEEVTGVARVDGIFNATNFKGDTNGLTTNPLMDEVPSKQKEINRIKADALRNPLLNGLAISGKKRALAITVIADADKSEKNFDTRFSNDVQAVMDKHLEGKVSRYFQIGSPFVRKELVRNILGDQRTLIPLSVVVLLFLLVLGLRTPNGAIMPVITGGLSCLWMTGFMGLMGIPLNVLTVIAPSILLVIGATEDMHIISEYFEGLEGKNNRMTAIEYFAKKVGLAVMLTALTTFIGFLSICFNDITLLKQFGAAAAFGLGVNFFITISLIPIYLRYFGDKKSPFADGKNKHGRIAQAFEWVAQRATYLTTKKKREVVVTTVILAALCVVGSFFIKLDNNFIGYFKESSLVRQNSKVLHEELSGVHSLYMTFDGRSKGYFKQADALKRLFRIHEHIAGIEGFDNSISIAKHVALIHREMNGGKEEFFKVPDDDALIPQYLLFFQRRDVDRSVDSEYRRANMIVRHNIASSYELKEALIKLDKKVKEIIGDEVDYKVTGEGVIINQAADSMASGQAMSLSLLLVVIFAVISLLFVNLKAGALSLIPNALPIIFLFGMMGWLGVPLNTGTAMIAAIAIGIAVDDTIHFMSRYNLEMKHLNNQQNAAIATIRAEIRPVMTTSIALALGFAVLGLSNFNPTVHFGLLSALVMIVAFLADVVITPILCANTKLITFWDMLGLKLTQEVIEKSALFKGMTSWEAKKVVLLGHVKDIPKAGMLIKQGEKGRSMFLILEGHVDVIVEKEDGSHLEVDQFGAGDIVGEVALVDAVERTASVIALKPTKALVITWESLQLMRRIHPIISSKLFLNIARILGGRLEHDAKMLKDMAARA